MVETRSRMHVEGEGSKGRGTTGVSAQAGGSFPRGGVRVGRQFLSNSQAYTLLALAHALLALPHIFMPRLAAKAMFGKAADPTEDQHTHLLNLSATGLLATATVCFALEESARKNMLHSFTADTLKVALMAFSALGLLLPFYYPLTLSPLAALVNMVAFLATFALPASHAILNREDRNRIWRDFQRLPHNLPSMFALRRRSTLGALYLLLTIAFPLAGLAYFIAPHYTLYHTFGYVFGKSTMLLWKMLGAGLMTLLPAMTFTLKDKTESDLLGRSISRTLNLGLGIAAVGHLLVFGPILSQAHGGYILPFLTGTWATALLTSMLGLSAPEVAAAAQQAAQAAESAPQPRTELRTETVMAPRTETVTVPEPQTQTLKVE